MKDRTTKAMAQELRTLVRRPEIRNNVTRVAKGLQAFVVTANGQVTRRNTVAAPRGARRRAT